ncbi:hypothetical protein ACO22_00146 [Paracoccidioides brasiliensis]|uniref:Uncharacterized protein n=1 Tax=Paracoccidioides brasiliensis TaxID=121759 RepID=A0A1D2JQL7_PARBR|nr:hypothetical protein ACO22_00146 [Paracoccidioides brasiliensis]
MKTFFLGVLDFHGSTLGLCKHAKLPSLNSGPLRILLIHRTGWDGMGWGFVLLELAVAPAAAPPPPARDRTERVPGYNIRKSKIIEDKTETRTHVLFSRGYFQRMADRSCPADYSIIPA